MTTRQMDLFIRHCDKYFGQKNEQVIHPTAMNEFHIDILLYGPTDKFPYWKMVTMGASDYKMPSAKGAIARQNEYIMLIDKDVDMNDKDTALWYCQKLWMISRYSFANKTNITYGHSIEWKNEDEADEMVAAFIEFPQMFDYGILHYKSGLFTDIACLLVVLLNKDDLDRLVKIGPQQFSEYLFPEDGNARKHFLSERNRSKKF